MADKRRELNLAYIIGTYPLLTTTFIDREINFLRQSGVNLQVVSIRRPEGMLSPDQETLQKGVDYLLPISWTRLVEGHIRFIVLHPLRYFATVVCLLSRPHPSAKSRLRTLLHFVAGVYAAHLLRRHTLNQIHAQFIDRAATLAMVASRFLNVPYSATAHAVDIHVDPVLLAEKISQARFLVTCSAYNKAQLSQVAGADHASKVVCIRHGLDAARYQPGSTSTPGRFVLLAVGQLKQKKGFCHLIKACRTLKDDGYDFECQIVGEGPLREALADQIRQSSLVDTVRLCGALPHDEVVEKYRQSSIFVLPCIMGEDGDRDGIPNAILEAMAAGLPIVSTYHAGIPEAVEDGVNGFLVPPEDGAALAEALAKLMKDPNCRRRFGKRGRDRVVRDFDVRRNGERLLAMFAVKSATDRSEP